MEKVAWSPDSRDLVMFSGGRKDSGEFTPSPETEVSGYQRINIPPPSPAMRSGDEELLPLDKWEANSWTGEDLLREDVDGTCCFLGALNLVASSGIFSRNLKLEGKEVLNFVLLSGSDRKPYGVGVKYADGTMDEFLIFDEVKCVIVDDRRHIIAVAHKFKGSHIFVLE